MSLRLVVYAEGGRELGAMPGSGEILAEDELGPAHEIVRRCIAGAGRVPGDAVLFARPLRLRGGKTARGSDLLHASSARRLLAWPPGGRAPDAAVFLVDADGDPARRAAVEAAVGGAMTEPVIGVAVQEFEAWLVADDACVARVLTTAFPTPRAPEGMRRREAKELLDRAIDRSGLDPRRARRTIARTCDLEVTADRCPAFRRFREELVAHLP